MIASGYSVGIFVLRQSHSVCKMLDLDLLQYFNGELLFLKHEKENPFPVCSLG